MYIYALHTYVYIFRYRIITAYTTRVNKKHESFMDCINIKKYVHVHIYFLHSFMCIQYTCI